MSDENVVLVATGIILRGGKVLMLQRRFDKEFPFYWECPGGKIEDGEDSCKALYRELCEEIGLRNAKITEKPFRKTDFGPPVVQRNTRLHYHAVSVPDDFRPRDMEGCGYGWFDINEATHLTLAPGNRDIGVLWSMAEKECKKKKVNWTLFCPVYTPPLLPL